MPGTPLDTHERTGAPAWHWQSDIVYCLGGRIAEPSAMLHKLGRTHGDVGHEMAGIGRDQLALHGRNFSLGALLPVHHVCAQRRVRQAVVSICLGHL